MGGWAAAAVHYLCQPGHASPRSRSVSGSGHMPNGCRSPPRPAIKVARLQGGRPGGARGLDGPSEGEDLAVHQAFAEFAEVE